VKPPPLAGHTWHPVAALALLLAYFVLLGVILGAQGVLWADVIAALQLTEGTFGTAQAVLPLIAVGLLLLGGPLSAQVGKKRLGLAALAFLGLENLACARADSLGVLVGAFTLGGISIAFLETAMNGATLDWEQATGRPIMNAMHAGYSGGAVAGALAAGMLRDWGWNHSQVFTLLAVPCGIVLLVSVPVRYPPFEPSKVVSIPSQSTTRLLRGPSVLALLALLCFLGSFCESAPNTWSVIYLRGFEAPPLLAGAAFALFNLMMMCGRLANAKLVARFGERRSLMLSGAGLFLSAVLLLLPGLPAAVAAFAIMGLAVAGVVPTILSAAARRVPGSSGAISGAILAVTYVSFIVSPPLVGWLAELVSLRLALLSVGVCGLGMLALAGVKLPRDHAP